MAAGGQRRLNGSIRSLSTGARNPGPAPANDCPVIEGSRLAAMRPALPGLGVTTTIHPEPTPSISAVSGNFRPWPWDGRCDGQGCAARAC